MHNDEYIEHLKKNLSSSSENSEFRKILQEHKKEFHMVVNLNLDPVIPLLDSLYRDSHKFKEIMNQRTATERCNYLNDTYHLDRSSRSADYGLIRLTLANIVEHALIRYLEAVKKTSEEKLFFLTLENICPGLSLRFLKAA